MIDVRLVQLLPKLSFGLGGNDDLQRQVRMPAEPLVQGLAINEKIAA
jgi:hypothetical protein